MGDGKETMRMLYINDQRTDVQLVYVIIELRLVSYVLMTSFWKMIPYDTQTKDMCLMQVNVELRWSIIFSRQDIEMLEW